MIDVKTADVFRMTNHEPDVHVVTVRAEGEDVQRFRITDAMLRLAVADGAAMAYYRFGGERA